MDEILCCGCCGYYFGWCCAEAGASEMGSLTRRPLSRASLLLTVPVVRRISSGPSVAQSATNKKISTSNAAKHQAHERDPC